MRLYIYSGVSRSVWSVLILKAFTALAVSLSLRVSLWLSLSFSDVGVWSWFLKHFSFVSCQGRWHWTRSVVVQGLPQLLATLLVFCHAFACGINHISQLSIMLQKKTRQKTLSLVFFSCFFPVMIILNSFTILNSFKPVPSASSEPVDNRPPTQEGKQTSQESASTSKRLRSNQAPVKTLIASAMEGPDLKVT